MYFHLKHNPCFPPFLLTTLRLFGRVTSLGPGPSVVGWSVGWLDGLSVGQSSGWSVGQLIG